MIVIWKKKIPIQFFFHDQIIAEISISPNLKSQNENEWTGSRAQFKIATGLVFPLYTYSQKFYFKQSDITISIKCSN